MNTQFLFPLLACLCQGGAIESEAVVLAQKEEAQPDAAGVVDAPIDEYRLKLLDLGYRAALTMPLHPHIKNRSREIEAVANVCLDLDQPRLALRYIEEIPNWRRGAGYGAYALYCAESGHSAEARRYIDRAQEIADWPAEQIGQDWRKDRIKVKIAETHLALGEADKAGQVDASLVSESEMGKVRQAEAALLPEDDFEAQMKALENAVDTQHFDVMQNALHGYAYLYERFYAEESRRTRIEKAIKDSLAWQKLPLQIRFELLLKLAGFATDHGDSSTALGFAAEAQKLIDDFEIGAEFGVPMRAALAKALAFAGDAEGASRQADFALAQYENGREEIVDIFRAEALRPLAEAYHEMGSPAAPAVYRLTVEEGFLNKNTRPRAEDLSATCRSMASVGFEPSPDLWDLMNHIHGELGREW